MRWAIPLTIAALIGAGLGWIVRSLVCRRWRESMTAASALVAGIPTGEWLSALVTHLPGLPEQPPSELMGLFGMALVGALVYPLLRAIPSR